MPRFENEGFNPKRRIDNDKRDRHVPDDENYYKDITPEDDYVPQRYSDSPVIDNQQNNYSGNNFQNIGSHDSALDMFDSSKRRTNRNAAYRYENDEGTNKRSRAVYGNDGKKPRPGKKKSKSSSDKRRAWRIVLSIIIAIILILVIMVESVLAKVNYDDHVDNKYVTEEKLTGSSSVKNILLLGVDARKNQKNETSRPDTMMLISLDMKHHCIKMTSFLRDTWVYVPSLDRHQRLNASTSKDGYSGVVDTIEYNFGVDIDGYVVTNFEMFRALVDSVGGVEINVTKKEAKEVNKHKKRYGNVKLKSGTNVLNGKQALAYCRIRKIDTDFYRTQRQRTVMTALLDKAKKNPFRLYSMANASAEYIETDLTKSQLKSVAAFAMICVSGEMFQERIPFEGTWEYANKGGASVISINIDKNKQKLIDYIFNKTSAELKSEQEAKDSKNKTK